MLVKLRYPRSVCGYKKFLCVCGLPSARSSAVWDDNNKANVCTPSIPAGLKCPPHPQRPSHQSPGLRSTEQVLFLVLLQKMSPADTFLVASRNHRPHPRSLQAPPVPARASFSSSFFFHLTYSRWTSSLPSCLWSQRIFSSLPGSRLTIFIAMQVQHSYNSSTTG